MFNWLSKELSVKLFEHHTVLIYTFSKIFKNLFSTLCKKICQINNTLKHPKQNCHLLFRSNFYIVTLVAFPVLLIIEGMNCEFFPRRSVEIVELETKKQQILKAVTNSPTKDGSYKSPAQKKVTLSHVAKVVSEVYGSNLSGSSSSKESLPLQQKVLISTLLLLLKKEKAKEITVSKVRSSDKKGLENCHVLYK